MGDIHGLLGADPNDLEEFLDAAGLCEPCLTVPIGSLWLLFLLSFVISGQGVLFAMCMLTRSTRKPHRKQR